MVSSRPARALTLAGRQEAPVRARGVAEDALHVLLVGLGAAARAARCRAAPAARSAPSSMLSHSVTHALPRSSGSGRRLDVIEQVARGSRRRARRGRSRGRRRSAARSADGRAPRTPGTATVAPRMSTGHAASRPPSSPIDTIRRCGHTSPRPIASRDDSVIDATRPPGLSRPVAGHADTSRDRRTAALLHPRAAPRREIARRPRVERAHQVEPGGVAELVASSGSRAGRRGTASGPMIISSCRITIGALS